MEPRQEEQVGQDRARAPAGRRRDAAPVDLDGEPAEQPCGQHRIIVRAAAGRVNAA